MAGVSEHVIRIRAEVDQESFDRVLEVVRPKVSRWERWRLAFAAYFVVVFSVLATKGDGFLWSLVDMAMAVYFAKQLVDALVDRR